MKETEGQEYSEMKKLLDDEELNKIAEPIFSYLKATLSIRNKNIDCTVDITNSAGYTNHASRYAYPWGLSQILLNCSEVKFSDLDYFIRAFSPYFLIKNIEKSYRYTTTKGKKSTSTATEKWIVASENSSFVKLLQHWDSKKPPQLKFPETVTILEAMRWYFCLNLLEQSKEHSPMIETEKVISKVTGKNQIPREFMDFEKMFSSRDIVNQIQPAEGERIIYVLGKCELSTSPSDSSSYRCDGIHSLLLDPVFATQLKKNVNVSADDIKFSIISDYAKYVKEDPSNALSRKRAIASFKSQIGKEGTSAIIPSNLDKQEKDLLESEGWIKFLPNGMIILAKGKTIREIDEALSELEKELEKKPELWWNRVIEIRAKKEISNDKKSPDETVIDEKKIKEKEPSKINQPQEVLPELEPITGTLEPINITKVVELPITGITGVKFNIGWKCDKKIEQNIRGWDECISHLTIDNSIQWWPGNNDYVVNLNIAIAGDMGTGKTQLTKKLVYNTIDNKENNYQKQPVGFIIFDYKGDYSSDKDEVFVKKTNAFILDSDKEPFPINILKLNPKGGKKQVIKRINSLWNILQKIYTNLGPKQKELLKKAIKNAYEKKGIIDDEIETYCNKPPTIYDVFDEYKEISDADSLYSILSDIIDNKLFLTESKDCIDINDLFSKTYIIRLDSLGNQIALKDLIVTFFLDIIYDKMITMPDGHLYGENKQYREIRTFILVDEADNLLQKEFEFFKNILKEGRSRGFGVILSTQYLSHYKTQSINYAEYFRTWFIHQIPNVDKNELKKIGFDDLSEQIKTLPKFHSFFKGDLDTGYKTIRIKDEPFFKQK